VCLLLFYSPFYVMLSKAASVMGSLLCLFISLFFSLCSTLFFVRALTSPFFVFCSVFLHLLFFPPFLRGAIFPFQTKFPLFPLFLPSFREFTVPFPLAMGEGRIYAPFSDTGAATSLSSSCPLSPHQVIRFDFFSFHVSLFFP